MVERRFHDADREMRRTLWRALYVQQCGTRHEEVVFLNTNLSGFSERALTAVLASDPLLGQGNSEGRRSTDNRVLVIGKTHAQTCKTSLCS